MNNTEKCEFCSKKTLRNEQEKKELINRLRRIEGQVRGICKMIENDDYCADILTQTTAVSSAVNSFSRELLNKHINNCVVNGIKDGNTDVVDELNYLLKKLMK